VLSSKISIDCPRDVVNSRQTPDVNFDGSIPARATIYSNVDTQRKIQWEGVGTSTEPLAGTADSRWKNYSSRAYLWPYGSTWLLMFAYHSNMIGTFRCQKFPNRELSLCRSQENSHGQRSSEKAKRTSVAKDFSMVPYCGAKDWYGRTFCNSRKCHNLKKRRPRNQRAAKNFDCARPNEIANFQEIAPETSKNLRKDPKKDQGKSPRPENFKYQVAYSSNA
jgi:hypothetical protein